MIRLFALAAATLVVAAFNLPQAAAAESGVSVRFSDAEIRTISAWYTSHESRKKGNGRRDGLPPGIARNLARGKSLPPGIAKAHLPDELRRSLPAAPAGYERVIVGGKILLVEVATQIIHDVLRDIVLD